MTRLVCIALHTSYGPVTLDPFALVVLHWLGDVLFLGCPTLEVLGLDIYIGLTEYAQQKVQRRAKPVGNANFIACRGVSMLVEAMQQQPMVGEQAANQTVERMVERDPEMVMEPVIEKTERRMVMEQTVNTIARNGWNLPLIAGWKRVVLQCRWNALSRALSGDPPVKGEPLRVILEPDKRPVRARPCTHSPVKPA